MKVILAGMSKTGTKSMVLALRELGMNVYDYMEHYQYNGKDWIRICEEGGSIEDFRRMYEGVDAVTDLPSWYFWEQLHQAYPNAKIILTLRDDEDEWGSSLQAQQDKMNNPLVMLMRYLSPTFRTFFAYGQVMGLTAYGILNRSSFKYDKLNQLQCKMVYRRHNTYVLQKAPKDKLLVYNVKQGWGPLCKFLEVDVPEKPFPHKNIRGNVYEEVMATNPVFIRMQREVMASLSIIALLSAYGCYKVVTSSSPLSTWCNSFANIVPNVFEKFAFWK